MATALESNQLKSGLIAHCKVNSEGISSVDELTTCGENLVLGFGRAKTSGIEKWTPSKWNQSSHSIQDLKGGNLSENINIMKKILCGDAKTGLVSSILVNAATAFLICGKVDQLGEGIELSESLIRDNKVRNWLERAETFF